MNKARTVPLSPSTPDQEWHKLERKLPSPSPRLALQPPSFASNSSLARLPISVYVDNRSLVLRASQRPPRYTRLHCGQIINLGAIVFYTLLNTCTSGVELPFPPKIETKLKFTAGSALVTNWAPYKGGKTLLILLTNLRLSRKAVQTCFFR